MSENLCIQCLIRGMIDMKDHISDRIDPVQLGHRLRAARKARGLTQQDAADHLGVARTTITAIEKGERRIRADEIMKLASLYARSANELVGQRETVENFPQFRAATIRGRVEESTIAAISDEFRRLCEDYLTLESLIGAPLTRRYPKVYTWGKNPKTAAEDAALAERKRLELGDGPLTELWDILQAQVGLRIFSMPIQLSVIAGMFAYHEKAGGCILLNGNHPDSRQRWSLAYEYAHFLSDRYKPHITFLRSPYGRTPDVEQFADQFAMSFLMPISGLRQKFREIVQSRDGFTPADLFSLAHLYSVSLEAMCLRLEGLRLIPSGTWDTLKKQGFKVKRMQESTRLCEDREIRPVLPLRYQLLAVQAFEQGKLTEGQLARFLRCDRIEARELVMSIFRSREVDEQGQINDLVLDASKSIGVVDF